MQMLERMKHAGLALEVAHGAPGPICGLTTSLVLLVIDVLEWVGWAGLAEWGGRRMSRHFRNHRVHIECAGAAGVS